MRIFTNTQDKKSDSALEKAKRDAVSGYDMKIKPMGTLKALLGKYHVESHVTGFSIEIRPTPKPADSVTTHVTRIVDGSDARFFLDIANASKRPVSVRVYPM